MMERTEALVPTMAARAELLAQLDALIEGDVHTDPISQMLYATDASIYQETPLGVARPRNKEDCAAIVRFAASHRIPLIPRAGGTSLAGQCVGAGLVVDVSRYMTGIVAIDPEARRARVQPGVILDDLNDALAPHGLLFGPDTSTSNRCMLGGMIGNNSCGTHSILWGTTRDHTLELEAILSDGSLARFGPLTAAELEQKLALDNLEGEIYRTLHTLVDEHRDAIIAAFPRPEIVRRNTGYPLDTLAQGQPWVEDGLPFNLARFLTGTEGTLALVTEATVNLVPRPKHKALVCAHFTSLDASMRGTVIAVEHGPAAVELMDKRILDQTEGNIEQARNRFWLEGDPEAVLAIELYDDDPDQLDARMAALIADYRERGLGYAFPTVRGDDLRRVWDLRKAGLGLLMGVPGDVKAVTVIEDTAVAVADLPEYVKAINEILHRYDTQCVFYAHASVGELHLRPELNLRKEDGLFKFRKIAEDTAEVVSRFGGSLSGEHGDGRLRGPFVRRMLGDAVYAMLEQIKKTCDPHSILNPNKIIDAQPIDTDLRMKTGLEVPEVETFFDWSADFGLVRAAEKCNGAGACRKSPGRGTMCPSYMATQEERDTTRGRANVFRHALSQSNPAEGLTQKELYDVLDLCLSCKGCKSECPASVDMARMKAEFLQHYHDRHGTPLRSRVFGEFARLTRLGAWAPGLTSGVINSGPMKWMLGVHPARTVPPLAQQTFGAWAKRHTPIKAGGQAREVLVFNDAFTHYNDPHVGRAVVRFLETAGYGVTVTQGLESGRTQISKGLLRRAREVTAQAVEALYPHASKGTPIVGLEPSAILSFRDEVPDLLEGDDLKRKARAVAEHTLTFEEFVVAEADAGRLAELPWSDDRPTRFLLHGHCHQKALVGIQPSVQALAIIPDAEVEVIPSGCCGMAGSFGYEKEHYDVSMQIGELVLFPAVREAPAEVAVVAAGTSCRHQIADGANRHALHPAEVLARAVGVIDI